MVWCFSTRASVATLLSMHPCISSCLQVNDGDFITGLSKKDELVLWLQMAWHIFCTRASATTLLIYTNPSHFKLHLLHLHHIPGYFDSVYHVIYCATYMYIIYVYIQFDWWYCDVLLLQSSVVSPSYSWSMTLFRQDPMIPSMETKGYRVLSTRK